MDIRGELLAAGFQRVIALRGADFGIECRTLLLAICTYEAETTPCGEGGWIHPYYPVSQRAYMAAADVTRRAQEAGIGLMLRDDIRVKPVFARLPGFSQGRNTLSYLEGIGSRFHVQIMTLDEDWAPDLVPEAAHPLHCGDCRACMDACPTGAIDAEGFHRERCLRNWQLSGKIAPEPVRAAMGNRLIGCDECQRCCPHNPLPTAAANATIPLAELLRAPKEASAALKGVIGANLAIPNRVLAQACLLGGAQDDLLPLAEHPSEAVREHARWALARLSQESRADDA